MVLPHDFTLTWGMSYKQATYEGRPSTLVDNDRQDHQVRLNTSLKKGIWEGLSAQISGEAVHNTSNFDPYTYEKFIATFSLIYEF